MVAFRYVLSSFLTTTNFANNPSAMPATSVQQDSPIIDTSVNNTPLRILPLGNSITWGYQSTDGNGYRLPLLNLLAANDTTIQYIGSQKAGNMTNNANEGHPGATIAQIAQFANASLPQQPNVVLLMAGTNDMGQNNETATAPQRLSSLIDQCLAQAHNAVIVVAQLTPSTDAAFESRIETFNAKIPALIAEKVGKGMKVLSINMTMYVSTNDLADGLHPNDYGYKQMAKGWYEGIEQAIGKGWVSKPTAILGP